MSTKLTPEQIDAILPQTQCGLCGYNGCMPYATALAQQQAAINLCPPGGIKGLIAIANLMNADPEPFMTDMEQKAKPAMRAVIREAECIGCTKCIQACPVDAILGAGKLMHTVITDECTGCELCVAPCPVDCIDMIVMPEETSESKKTHYRNRYQARQTRLQKEKQPLTTQPEKINLDKKAYIQAAIARAKAKVSALAPQSDAKPDDPKDP